MKKEVSFIGSNGQVSNTEIHVSRIDGDEVVWYSNGSEAAWIVFASLDGSPFTDTKFHVPAGGSVSTGIASKTGLTIGHPYKYTVVGKTGVNDPVIIIDN